MRNPTIRSGWGTVLACAAGIFPLAALAEQPSTQSSLLVDPRLPQSIEQRAPARHAEPVALAQAAQGVQTPQTAQPGEGVAIDPTVATDAQAKKEALNSAMKNAYQGVFYANQFDYLNDPAYVGPYFIGDGLKGMAAGRLDVGGEYRSRYHHENNFRGLGLTGRDDEFWLSRVRLFSNYRLTDNIRVFGEYLYADSGGETFAPRPIEENRGEAQNLFVDLRLVELADGTISTRVGRQELLLGEQRLVSPLDWANTRRTFDGYRLSYSSQGISGDTFYTNPVLRVPSTAGTNVWDSSNNNQSFYGSYWSLKDPPQSTVDAYYLGYDNQDENFSFHTLGSRLAGSSDILLYELEGGVQFGDNSNGSSHNAAFLTAGLGRKLELCLSNKSWTPTLWGWYDYASGGNSALVSRGDNGFDHLFPLAHKYNGFMDLFGRRNLHDVNLQLNTPLGTKSNLLLWYHYFFLDQATTPYSVAMTPFNAGVAGSRDLGHEIDLLFTLNVDPRNSVLLGYSFFGAGRYYDTTPGVPTNADADFLYAQYQTRF